MHANIPRHLVTFPAAGISGKPAHLLPVQSDTRRYGLGASVLGASARPGFGITPAPLVAVDFDISNTWRTDYLLADRAALRAIERSREFPMLPCCRTEMDTVEERTKTRDVDHVSWSPVSIPSRVKEEGRRRTP